MRKTMMLHGMLFSILANNRNAANIDRVMPLPEMIKYKGFTKVNGRKHLSKRKRKMLNSK